MDLAEADARKARLIEVEGRKARGEPVFDMEYAQAHREYGEAEIWRSEQEAAQRRADMQAQGIVPGPTQGIGLGR